ncbi:MAG: sulfite exporter TauE/SafE family protein [Nitrososphaerota archaeon]
MFEFLLLFLISIGIGIISSLTGIGGGSFIVPILIMFFNISTHKAIGTSLLIVIFTAISSTFAYYKQKRIDYKSGLYLIIGTIPGALIGAYLTNFFSSKELALLFGFFLIFISFRIIYKAFKKNEYDKNYKGKEIKNKKYYSYVEIIDSKGEVFKYYANIPFGILFSIFAGISSGMFGVGGGALAVPIMHIIVGMPMHIAIATSMFIMIFTSFSGVIGHILLGNILVELAMPLCIGIIFGTQVGALIARKLKARILEIIFGLILIIISLNLILKNLMF